MPSAEYSSEEPLASFPADESSSTYTEDYLEPTPAEIEAQQSLPPELRYR